MKECHAKLERGGFSFMSIKGKKGTLDIAMDVNSESSITTQTCDAIVVSLIVIEKWRRYFY